jgi:hypothetical protein
MAPHAVSAEDLLFNGLRIYLFIMYGKNQDNVLIYNGVAL